MEVETEEVPTEEAAAEVLEVEAVTLEAEEDTVIGTAEATEKAEDLDLEVAEATEAEAEDLTEVQEKCIKQSVPTAKKNAQFHSSQQKENQSIAESAFKNVKITNDSLVNFFIFLNHAFKSKNVLK